MDKLQKVNCYVQSPGESGCEDIGELTLNRNWVLVEADQLYQLEQQCLQVKQTEKEILSVFMSWCTERSIAGLSMNIDDYLKEKYEVIDD